MSTYKHGHISSRSRAYARVGKLFLDVKVGADDPTSQVEEHVYGWKPIWMTIGRVSNTNPLRICLTEFTTEELETFREVINLAVDDALVIAQDLDAKAIELLNEGAEEIPYRALASRPPFHQRPIPLEYVRPDLMESDCDDPET